jgi:signal peptidase I
MMDTLQSDDRLLLYKVGKYKRGDIIVFVSPETVGFPEDKQVLLVKRIIGLPGDTVSITRDPATGVCVTYVNDKPIDEPYVKDNFTGNTVFSYTQLGDDEFFYMGDNRLDSKDSRYGLIGTFSKDVIKGRAILRFIIGNNEDGKFVFDMDAIKRTG